MFASQSSFILAFKLGAHHDVWPCPQILNQPLKLAKDEHYSLFDATLTPTEIMGFVTLPNYYKILLLNRLDRVIKNSKLSY